MTGPQNPNSRQQLASRHIACMTSMDATMLACTNCACTAAMHALPLLGEGCTAAKATDGPTAALVLAAWATPTYGKSHNHIEARDHAATDYRRHSDAQVDHDSKATTSGAFGAVGSKCSTDSNPWPFMLQENMQQAAWLAPASARQSGQAVFPFLLARSVGSRTGCLLLQHALWRFSASSLT